MRHPATPYCVKLKRRNTAHLDSIKNLMFLLPSEALVSKAIDDFVSLLHYGTVLDELGPLDLKRYFMGLLKVVGSDGLSYREKWAFSSLCKHLGVPERVVDELLATDTSRVVLSEVAEIFERGASPQLMLYDAITIASIDEYTEIERDEARAMAQTLSIPEEELREIEALVASESALRKRKAELLVRR
jgi:hypothetical protein